MPMTLTHRPSHAADPHGFRLDDPFDDVNDGDDAFDPELDRQLAAYRAALAESRDF